MASWPVVARQNDAASRMNEQSLIGLTTCCPFRESAIPTPQFLSESRTKVSVVVRRRRLFRRRVASARRSNANVSKVVGRGRCKNNLDV